MDPKRVARKKVAARLKRFFEHLTSATGTADLWQKVEHRLSQKRTASETGTPALRTPMQQQPVQQQQAQTKAEDK